MTEWVRESPLLSTTVPRIAYLQAEQRTLPDMPTRRATSERPAAQHATGRPRKSALHLHMAQAQAQAQARDARRARSHGCPAAAPAPFAGSRRRVYRSGGGGRAESSPGPGRSVRAMVSPTSHAPCEQSRKGAGHATEAPPPSTVRVASRREARRGRNRRTRASQGFPVLAALAASARAGTRGVCR